MKLRKKTIILLLILGISIGFAVLTSNFGLKGYLSFQESSFNVHFDNVNVKDTNLFDYSTNIENDNLSIITTGTFESPGDYIDISFYVVNSGTMDAFLNTLSVSGISTELSNYFAYTLKYDVGETKVLRGDVLRAGQGRKINLHIEYKYDVDQLTIATGLTLNVSMNYVNPKKAITDTVWNYEYTGGEQIFYVKKSGRYKLETWGAQGGYAIYSDILNIGGYGGYSVGEINLNKDDQIYIYVGQEGGGIDYDGISNNYIGYNGGGYPSYIYNNSSHGGGGGATHVALSSGLLKNLENNVEDILIVAGGGGGSSSHKASPRYSGIGGSGGGYIGGNGTTNNNFCYNYGTGGTQTSVGHYIKCLSDGHDDGSLDDILPNPASFGYGANYSQFYNMWTFATFSGGGGGFYGGWSGYHGPGGGGSGYIGNDDLKNKVMYCYNCTEHTLTTNPNDFNEDWYTISTTNVSKNATSNYAKIGDGYVRITYLGK